jgi:hypothetical protein
MSKTHMVIPDTQVKHGTNTDHIEAAGKMFIDKKPDVLVIIGDWWDFPSLSTFTSAQKIGFEQRTYNKDLVAGIDAMELFLKPFEEYNERQLRNKKKTYKPTMVFTVGNHEYRVDRLLEQNTVLEGVLPRCEDYLLDKGFHVIPFKQKAVIDDVTYCHFCPATASNGAVGRAHTIAAKRNSSWTVGHSQILDYHVSPHTPRVQCIIAGAFYTHDEGYKVGSNDHWRGLLYKTNVKDGSYDVQFKSIDGLLEEY